MSSGQFPVVPHTSPPLSAAGHLTAMQQSEHEEIKHPKIRAAVATREKNRIKAGLSRISGSGDYRLQYNFPIAYIFTG